MVEALAGNAVVTSGAVAATPPAAVPVTAPATSIPANPPVAAPVAVVAPVAATATPGAPTGTLMSEAAKPDAAPAKTEAAPAAADFKLEIPKDSGLVQADVDGIAAIAKAEGLNQKQATALVAREAAQRAESLTKVQKQFQESAAQFAADPVYGGTNLAQSKIEMRRALNSPLMPADLKAVLSDPKLPYGDFAPLARFITNVGRTLGEDGMIPVSRQPASKADVPIHHVFYPPQKSG